MPAQPPPDAPADLRERLLRDYGDDLGDPALGEDQKAEVLLALWRIMVAFVDLGFSYSARPGPGETAAPDIEDVLEYLCLDETPHETVAPPETMNRKDDN